jgi:hypothetical protein
MTTIKIEEELRQRARLAWEEECYSLEAIRQEAKAKEEERLAKKCQEVLGAAPTQKNGRDGWIGSLHLRYKGDPYGSSHLCLVAQCPFCGEKIESYPIRAVADLGANLVALKTSHICHSHDEPDPTEAFKERLVAALIALVREYSPDEEVLP